MMIQDDFTLQKSLSIEYFVRSPCLRQGVFLFTKWLEIFTRSHILPFFLGSFLNGDQWCRVYWEIAGRFLLPQEFFQTSCTNLRKMYELIKLLTEQSAKEMNWLKLPTIALITIGTVMGNMNKGTVSWLNKASALKTLAAESWPPSR